MGHTLVAGVQGTETNSPTPNPSPSERGVNTLASCWRTGHGDPVLLWFASLLGMQIKVGWWPPCPILQHPNIKPQPLPHFTLS